MSDPADDEATWLADVEAVRANVQTPVVIRFVAIERVRFVRPPQAVQYSLAYSDLVDVDHHDGNAGGSPATAVAPSIEVAGNCAPGWQNLLKSS